MSVFNLTISYVRPYVSIDHSFDDLSFRKKKYLLKGIIVFFVVFSGIYIYITGEVIAENHKLEILKVSAKQISSDAIKTEIAYISESSDKSLEYFIAQGYEEPKNVDIIKRVSNVAVGDETRGSFY